MAYNTSTRFQYSSRRFRIFDPGAYQYPYSPLTVPNKVPFLSKAPRETAGNKIWTHTVHFPKKQGNIPHCTSLQSKVPRFSYEAEKPKEVVEILCDCDSDVLCTCPEKNDDAIKKKREIWQGQVPRRLFTGPANDYSITRVTKPRIDVPFYDTRRVEFTSFYRGCKWSRWTSTREANFSQQGPGPADYNFEQSPDLSKICAEKVRAKRRRTSQQLRFIEIVQRRTIRDNHPSPASYNPIFPKRKDFQYPTSTKHKGSPESKSAGLAKASPGPADYQISRDFDIKTRDRIECHVKLPKSAPFGVKDVRFKQIIKSGPSPNSYCINNLNLCRKDDWKQSNKAPFGSTSSRFKEILSDDDLTEDYDDSEYNKRPKCIAKTDNSTWVFKSKTIRLKLPKFTFTGTYKNPMDKVNGRSKKLQYLSPFHTSEGRFRNWNNWIPIYGSVRTPDPARYCTEKPKCALVVFTGTFSRQRRFQQHKSETPAPNQFLFNDLEKYVLHTHNFKLRKNIRKNAAFSSIFN